MTDRLTAGRTDSEQTNSPPGKLVGDNKDKTGRGLTSIKSLDFLTLYTTIPHEKLESKLSIHTVLALNWKDTVSISDQLYLQEHR